MNTNDEIFDEVQKRFLKRHWKMTIVFGAIFAAAVTAAILVFFWFVGHAQATNLVPATLGQWSIGIVFTFILHVIFWELVLVVSWVIVVAVVIIFQWYKKLPSEEQEGWSTKRGRREEGDAFSFFIVVIWLIIVWFDNRWNLAFEDWTFNDWVYSFGAALFWMFLIIGVPVAIYFMWWLRKEMYEESSDSTETVEEVVDEP